MNQLSNLETMGGLPSKGSNESFHKSGGGGITTSSAIKDKRAPLLTTQNSLKPMEICTAERLKKQVEDYIKKRIEHLEVMRDQVERVQQMRLEKQVTLVIEK